MGGILSKLEGSSTSRYDPPEATEYSQPNPATGQKRKYSQISDNYNSLEQVTEALISAGLESSNLIVGIDFTKSNEWRGTTHDQEVFNFFEDGRPCAGFTEALSRYREIVPHLQLAGPTSFAPIVEMATTIVEQSGGLYHVLLIIADGQVTGSCDTQSGHLTPLEQKTVNAIVKACEFPMSIVLVGVGDGPWDKMKEFDDNIPARSFDNFQFVNLTEIMSRNLNHERKETEFALAALMEIPSQFKATIELGLLSNSARSPRRVALPPPDRRSRSVAALANTFQENPSPFTGHESPPTSSTSFASTASRDSKVCLICSTKPKNLAFGCGHHETCYDCGKTLANCPICRSEIFARIRLY